MHYNNNCDVNVGCQIKSSPAIYDPRRYKVETYTNSLFSLHIISIVVFIY